MGLCVELASAPCKPRGNPQDRAASLGGKVLATLSSHLYRLVCLLLFLSTRTDQRS